MKLPFTIATVSTVFAVFVFIEPVPASAQERVCRSSIGATTVGSIRVPEDATCQLTGTTVNGRVKVSDGATLIAKDVLGSVDNYRIAMRVATRLKFAP